MLSLSYIEQLALNYKEKRKSPMKKITGQYCEVEHNYLKLVEDPEVILQLVYTIQQLNDVLSEADENNV